MFINLEPKCPRSPMLPSVDPNPSWTFDDILSEIQKLESDLGLKTPSPLKKPPSHPRENLKVEETVSKSNRSFIMSLADFDVDGGDDDDDDNGSDSGSNDDYNRSLTMGVRFACDDFSDSEESEGELDKNMIKCSLINKKSLEEGILLEFEREHQAKYKEHVRSTISALELHNQKECGRSELSMYQQEKYIEDRREIDREVDMQYQRNIVEVLDSHLSVLQRDHEQRSQIEERRIKDAAAIEEAERKKKALYEEKLRREKAEAEQREKAAKLAEDNRLALEAAKRAAEEEATRIESERAATAIKATEGLRKETQKGSNAAEELGIRVMAADVALKAETSRLKMYNDVAKDIPNFPSKDLDKYGRRMSKILNQITGNQSDVRNKSCELIYTLNDPIFPHAIRTLIFAQRVVSFCETPRWDRAVFVLARIIILVSSEIPSVIDFVLAEFHKACIYTVPKHLNPSNPAARNHNYWKMIGYREEDNKIESTVSYLDRIELHMKLYAAMMQTEIQGIRNPYGLEQGWAWLAMFLNEVPPDRPSAIALYSFLSMAGYGLYRRYKSQFVKLLTIIAKSFLPVLKKKNDPKIVERIENYLKDRVYMKEPEGLRLEVQEPLSIQFVP